MTWGDRLAPAVAAIAGEQNLEPLLERIVEQAARLLGASGGAISLVGESLDAQRLLTATWGLPDSVRQRAIPANQGLMGQVIAAGGPVVVARYDDLDRPLRDSVFHQLGPWVAVPIWRDGLIIGTFGIGIGDRDRRIDAADVRLLEVFANHAAIAIENALLYRENHALAISEERNRLARDMHDTIAQTLASMRLDLAALREQLTAGHDVVGRLDRLDGSLTRAIDELRRAIWALNPAPLDGVTLDDALRGAVDSLAVEGIRAQFTVAGISRELAPLVVSNLFLIANEALGNVRRHAGASFVQLTLDYLEAELRLTIQDDGRGFDPASLQARELSSGFGLYAIRDRVSSLGGRLSIASDVAVGTRVRVAIPYEPPLASGVPRSPEPPRQGTRDQARVVLIDDHALVREGVRQTLERDGGFRVVAEAGNGRDGLRAIDREHPDLVLLDVRMPELDGLAVMRALAVRRDAPKVVVLTMSLHDEVVYEMVRAGARGYVVKDTQPEDLLRALRTVLAGGSPIAPVAANRLAERIGGAQITDRERDVLSRLERGLRNKEIAAELRIGEKTVQFHLANLFDKLGVRGRTEAVRVARERGLLGE